MAVADNRFHCVILKGGDRHPYFPAPLLSEFDFSIPLTSGPPKAKRDADAMDEDAADDADDTAPSHQHEQQYMQKRIAAAQLQDLLDASNCSEEHHKRLERLEAEMNKALLTFMAEECREGEDNGVRALDLVGLMRDRDGRVMRAAAQIAQRFGGGILGDKIRELGERNADALDDRDEF